MVASVIAGSPLWPQGQPEEFGNLWRDLKRELLAAGQDWDVWTDWYEHRLEGRVRDENHELAYVEIEDELWDQGPAVVNAAIKRRIAEIERLKASEEPPIEAIPDQAPVATTFGQNAQKLIDVVPDPPSLESQADALQREFYEETRDKAEVLAGFGHNQLGDLSRPVTRFLESLPERIEEVLISRAWSRGNTLRLRLKADDLLTAKAEPDPARLPPLVAESLRDLVHEWNIFIAGDPKGREFDETRLGPAELDAAKRVVAAAAPIVEAVRDSENIATPAAIEAVAEQDQAAAKAPAGADGDQAVDLSRKTTGNFVIQLLRSAYAFVRREPAFAVKEMRAGVYRAAGAAAYNHSPEILSFVARNADALKEFAEAAWHNPALGKIIEIIARAWS